jgi:RNA polymerase sigma-70 factor (ECF subfamily)
VAEQLSAATPVVTDADVMVAFARGDEGAFVKLYDAYKLRIFNLTRRLLGDSARAEEATQDVFLKLYQTRKSYSPTAKFSTFIYRIAVNHCLNAKAKKSERMVAADPDLDAKHESVSTTADASLEQKALRAALREALGKLPEQQRAALVLCHYEGSSYKEASDVLEVTESAVKSLVHRARTRLVQELDAWMPLATRSSS